MKDLFKLRKYNIHEVNKQIIQSQSNLDSARQEDKKANDPSIEKTNDNTQDTSETDDSHTGDKVVRDTVVQDKVVHDTVVQGTVVHNTVVQDTVVHDTGTANPNIKTVKKSQE